MKIDNTSLNDLFAKHYRNKDPEIFGPDYWNVLHTYAGKNQYDKAWLDKFTSYIPCGTCREHFSEMERPTDQNTFLSWTIVAHNKVNKRLGKPEFDTMKALSFYMDIG